MKIKLYKSVQAFSQWMRELNHKLRHYKHRTYLSGKISDCDDYEWNFRRSAELVRNLGYIPVNPCDLPVRKSWAAFMFWDCLELLTCSTIYMQKNWKQSRGAKIEHKLAKITRKTIIYQTK